MQSKDGAGETGGRRRSVRMGPRCALLAAALLAGCTPSRGTVPVPRAESGRSGPLAALEHGLRPTTLKVGEPLPGWSLRERMAHHRVPGVAIAILKDGEVVHAVGFGLRQAGSTEAVDGDTLFNVGSISKVVTAAASVRLVAQGMLDLDADVDTYLKSWRIPPAPGTPDPVVTLRMLMSHTAGLTVHGFDDFLPGEALPTLLDTLDGVSPANNEPVRLQREPGLLYDYSGGGTVVEQQVLEEVTGTPLEAIARQQVFAPIGMGRSTFESPLSAARGNIAKAHDAKGTPTALPRGWQSFPQEGAAGLWTSAKDLGAFVGALIQSYQGRGPFLPRALATQMMTEVSPSWHGLGPRLDGVGASRVFHHGGSNDSYHAWLEGYLETGDGFVILTNGENGWQLRTEIRNALSDALGHGVNPPVRTITLAPGAVALADYAGRYRADAGVPMDHRRSLTDVFDFETLEISLTQGALSVSIPGETGALLPLTPTRFVAPTVFGIQLEFHRDAHGGVRAVSVEHGASRAYYRREPRGVADCGAGSACDEMAHKREIEAVVEAFRRAIIDKDRERFTRLFLYPGIPWQSVLSDPTLRLERRGRPEAAKVRLEPREDYQSFIEGIVASKEREEERFRNVRTETDGDIASVFFDYSFHSADRETNHGKEAWHLVRTDGGWKIVSVIYSVTHAPTAQGWTPSTAP